MDRMKDDPSPPLPVLYFVSMIFPSCPRPTMRAATPGGTFSPELRFNLSNHSDGGEGRFRDDQGIHRVDLFLPLPPVATQIVGAFLGVGVTFTDTLGLIVKEVCCHQQLGSYSFLSTVQGRIPVGFRFAHTLDRQTASADSLSIPSGAS